MPFACVRDIVLIFVDGDDEAAMVFPLPAPSHTMTPLRAHLYNRYVARAAGDAAVTRVNQSNRQVSSPPAPVISLAQTNRQTTPADGATFVC